MIIKLNEISDMIKSMVDKSIDLNKEMLTLLGQSNKMVADLELSFLNTLSNQHTNEFYRDLAIKILSDTETHKTLLSDLIHLFEFKVVTIHGMVVKINAILEDRRRLKLFIGYCNRVQQERGFTNSIYWYNKQYSNNQCHYSLRNDINDEFKKEMIITKK